MEDIPIADTDPFISKGNVNLPSGKFAGYARFVPVDTAAVPTTEESEPSVDDSGPSTPTLDHDSLEENDGNPVIQPYAIEEAEDESESYTSRLDLPCLPDQFERWQRDLSDCMNDLNYQADVQHHAPGSPIRKRGRKRKSAHVAASRKHSCPSFERKLSSETQHSAHGEGTKRRRCNTMPEQFSSASSFDAFREANANESSSSETRSTDCSGIETLNNSPRADPMDID
jgi:hypothetical protein